jgi:hypothetical protein
MIFAAARNQDSYYLLALGFRHWLVIDFLVEE